MKITAAYIRVSTDDQLEYSPETQKELIRDYAKKHDLALPDEHIYEDAGISGRSADKRPGFQQMIANAKAKPKPFETILVWKYSRFARNQEESIVYKSLLKREYSIEVISISEPLADGPFGSLIERIIEWMDEYYSIRLAGEVKRGMKKRVESGKHVTAAPMGYAAKNGFLEIIPDEAEIVRMIFSDYLSGLSILAISDKLNGMGIKTRRGNMWENRTVRYILTNPVYIGKIRWSPEGVNDYHNAGGHSDKTMIVDGKHPAIISETNFQNAMDRLKRHAVQFAAHQRTEPGKKDFVLQGLVKCGACGGTLTHSGASALNCSRYVHGKCKKSHYVLEKTMEQVVFDAIQSQMRTLDFSVTAREKAAGDEHKIIQSRIDRELLVLERIKEAYANGIDTLEEYAENKKRCRERIARMRSRLSEAHTAEIDKAHYAQERLTDMKKVLSPDIPAKQKNLILRNFIEKIIYSKDEKSIEIYYRL